jgi:methylphosphotriester-DNA--protein-cysteine methyltransferase
MKPLAAILSLSATMALFAANVAPATTYQASAKSKVFHLPSCAHAKKIVAANLIIVPSKEDAAKKGYRPCATCKP